MDVLVIGGTLFIGRRLVNALLGAGHSVTVLHRNPDSTLPAHVKGLLADRNDGDSVRHALAGRRFDAVFDNVYDWQRGTTAEQVEATARACAGPRLSRYVFMSSVGAYREGLDLDEDEPLASSERTLFRMHRDEGFPSVTLRPPFIYGPGNPFYREAFFWDRLRDGRPIIVPDDGSRLMQFVHVDDLVRICMRVLDEPLSVGHAFNTAHASAVSQEQVVRALAEAAHREAHIVHVPREKALAAGGRLTGSKLYFGEVFDLPPITMRIDRARRTLGFQPAPFSQGLRETYEWWSANDPFPPPDYSFEDELLR